MRKSQFYVHELRRRRRSDRYPDTGKTEFTFLQTTTTTVTNTATTRATMSPICKHHRPLLFNQTNAVKKLIIHSPPMSTGKSTLCHLPSSDWPSAFCVP